GFVLASGTEVLPAHVRIPIRASGPDCADLLNQSLIGSASTHHRLQVEAGFRKKAGHEFSICGQTYPCAAAAKRFGDRTDDSNPSGTIQEFVIDRGRAATCPPSFTQRKSAFNCVEYLGFRKGFIEGPTIGVPDVHILDETHFKA